MIVKLQLECYKILQFKFGAYFKILSLYINTFLILIENHNNKRHIRVDIQIAFWIVIFFIFEFMFVRR